MTQQSYSNWRKSARSDANSNCVEASPSDDGTTVGMRDTKDRDGAALEFGGATWRCFIDGIRRGDFTR